MIAYPWDIEKLGLALTKSNSASDNPLLGTLLINFGPIWEPIDVWELNTLRFVGIFFFTEHSDSYVPPLCYRGMFARVQWRLKITQFYWEQLRVLNPVYDPKIYFRNDGRLSSLQKEFKYQFSFIDLHRTKSYVFQCIKCASCHFFEMNKPFLGP